jgi:phosphosulfolactate phosphohydrolase-like enzyme
LLETDSCQDVELNDAGKVAAQLGKSYAGELLELFRQSEHGRYLTGIGMGSDLQLCADVDAVPIIPIFKDDHIVQFHLKVNEEIHGS